MSLGLDPSTFHWAWLQLIENEGFAASRRGPGAPSSPHFAFIWWQRASSGGISTSRHVVNGLEIKVSWEAHPLRQKKNVPVEERSEIYCISTDKSFARDRESRILLPGERMPIPFQFQRGWKATSAFWGCPNYSDIYSSYDLLFGENS